MPVGQTREALAGFGAMGTPVVTLVQVACHRIHRLRNGPSDPAAGPRRVPGAGVDGWSRAAGSRDAWVPALACGVTFAAALASDFGLREWAATNRVERDPDRDVRAGPRLRHEPLRSGGHDLHFVAAGAGLAFMSPVLSWLGAAVQVASANALGALQDSVTPACRLPPNRSPPPTVGGVLGEMFSPQSPTIACAPVGLAGREGDLLREVLPWSAGLLLIMCLIVLSQLHASSTGCCRDGRSHPRALLPGDGWGSQVTGERPIGPSRRAVSRYG